MSTLASGESLLTSFANRSISDFLKYRKQHPSCHIVIGNEAGDADSILSTIALAFVESVLACTGDQVPQKTPIVSISRTDLETQRPETTLLLQLADISLDHLLFVNDLPSRIVPACRGDGDNYQIPTITDSRSSNRTLRVTLVDHNKLSAALFSLIDPSIQWNVCEIYDHHIDLGEYFDACGPGSGARRIAFENGQSAVASTSTLVVERLQEHVTASTGSSGTLLSLPLIPPSLGVLLLGTILLDSVNMSPQAGKGTPRDSAAIQTILQRTDWNHLSAFAKEKLVLTNTATSHNNNDDDDTHKAHQHLQPNTTALFELLQNAKFDIAFWRSLVVRDALRLDYKHFAADAGEPFGVSTVLMPLDDFVAKPDFLESIKRYMDEVNVNLLGIMFAYSADDETNGSQLTRQLMLCGRDGFPLDAMVHFLGRPHHDESLKLSESTSLTLKEDDDIVIRCFEQGNIKASRKQVVPILFQFFDHEEKSSL